MIAHKVCMYCKEEYGQEIWPDDGIHTEVTTHGAHWLCNYVTYKRKMINKKRREKNGKNNFALKEPTCLWT